MAVLSPRQHEIVDLARDAARVDVDSLAAHFDVTPQTIRKDLNELATQGLLQRFHGGAMLSSGVANLAYDRRRRLATGAKHAIGDRAAALIPDDCSLFINIGTTTEQVARALRGRRGLMVITNNLNVAHILQGQSHIEVVVAGGVLRHSDGGIVGEAAVEFIRQFKVDYAVIGASAIDPDGALLDFDYREVSVAKAIMAGSRHAMLVADHMKLSRSAPVRIGHLADLDTFVTDQPLPPELARLCEEANVAIALAGRQALETPERSDAGDEAWS
ncbi:MAG: DeoR/GlpR family DNA-binding transcription regulator [Burkholderiaceae bacterium]